ncbi:MAG: hypothetical protein ACREX3_00410 [Gammaproteobacteria bacterium]
MTADGADAGHGLSDRAHGDGGAPGGSPEAGGGLLGRRADIGERSGHRVEGERLRAPARGAPTRRPRVQGRHADSPGARGLGAPSRGGASAARSRSQTKLNDSPSRTSRYVPTMSRPTSRSRGHGEARNTSGARYQRCHTAAGSGASTRPGRLGTSAGSPSHGPPMQTTGSWSGVWRSHQGSPRSAQRRHGRPFRVGREQVRTSRVPLMAGVLCRTATMGRLLCAFLCHLRARILRVEHGGGAHAARGSVRRRASCAFRPLGVE